MAAPAAEPDSSKSPTIVQPVVLRPTRLTQVINVIAVSSTPASTAHSRASLSSSVNTASLQGAPTNRRASKPSGKQGRQPAVQDAK